MRLYGIDLFKLCLEYQPHNLLFLKEAFWNYAVAEKYTELKEIGDTFYDHAQTTVQKAFGSYQLIYLRMVGADWLEAISLSKKHEYLLTQLANEQPDYMEDFIRDSLMVISQPLLYIYDNPQKHRWIFNQLGKLFQKHCQNNFTSSIHSLSHSNYDKTDAFLSQINDFEIPPPPQNDTVSLSRKLRIGYIGHTMKKHSVGYLSRWLMHYHNKDEFVIGCYFVNNSLNADEINRQWFMEKADIAVGFSHNVNAIVRKIDIDRIDILVDLDSFTFNVTGCVMALKPAPIQVSWLGMDSNGIPAIDYFITDPYVLPDNAQEYYQEKIWRLPHTYLGIDGFEVGVPNITRKDLEIPENAIVYFNIQNALKRHPDHIRTQMKILQAVPESYLLIKGTGKQDIVRELFTHIAESEGIDISRLRFLDRSPTEAIHRANLRIADVILDTYPYNGATTTLETLWLEIPIVTIVGQQFAARNSYTFMINAGITEGIAYSEAEYIEWAIKLGRNENLRKQVTLKLKESKKKSPLWNGEQFTREMEKAYKQMWQIYTQEKHT